MNRACTGLLFAVAAAAAYWQSSRASVLWDVTYVLEIAHRLTLGIIPYRDVVVPQAPLTFVVQAAILRTIDAGYVGPRIYCALVAGATAALTYRIVRTQIEGIEGTRADGLACLVALPCVVLNGYAILPLPFYDPDCSLFVLLALATLLRARQRKAAGWGHALAGVLFVLPVLTKQNVGIGAFLIVHGCLLFSAAARKNGGERRAYAWFFAGSAVAAAIALVLLHVWSGLPNVYHWTVEYASAKRWPSTSRFFAPYLQSGTWFAAFGAAAGYSLLRRRGGPFWRDAAGLAVIGAPFLVAARTILRWGLAARAHYFWGLGTLVGGPVALASWVRDGWRFERAVPLIALGVAHAAFASQGMYDSSYSVWPFLLIAIAPLVAAVHRAAPDRARVLTALTIAASLGFSALGVLHVVRHERLGFADLSGPVQAASLPAIRGLAVPGTHVTDFERLIARCETLIPREDGVLAFPGEDPFFLASGRRPRLPIVLFDDTAMPYDGGHLLRLLDEHDIAWVVVKDQLQLRHSPWRHMESFLRDHLPTRYDVVETLPRYRIFKRRPATPAGASR
jgi:hypothetical protein